MPWPICPAPRTPIFFTCISAAPIRASRLSVWPSAEVTGEVPAARVIHPLGAVAIRMPSREQALDEWVERGLRIHAVAERAIQMEVHEAAVRDLGRRVRGRVEWLRPHAVPRARPPVRFEIARERILP